MPAFGYDPACFHHMTEDEKAQAQFVSNVVAAVHETARQQADSTLRYQVEVLQAQVDRLKEKLREQLGQRIYWIGRSQVVEVAGKPYRYAFSRAEVKLDVGEVVWVPRHSVDVIQPGHGPVRAVVTALGTTQTGVYPFVIRRTKG